MTGYSAWTRIPVLRIRSAKFAGCVSMCMGLVRTAIVHTNIKAQCQLILAQSQLGEVLKPTCFLHEYQSGTCMQGMHIGLARNRQYRDYSVCKE